MAVRGFLWPPGTVVPDTGQGDLLAVKHPQKEGDVFVFVISPPSNVSLGPLLITSDAGLVTGEASPCCPAPGTCGCGGHG